MTLIETIQQNLRVFHKVLSVPTSKSKTGIYFVKGGGVYVVVNNPALPEMKLVEKIYDRADHYFKGETNVLLQSQKDLLDAADALLQTQINNLHPLNTKKAYLTKAAADADTNPIGDDGIAIGIGQLVVVTSDTTTLLNGIYRLKSLTSGIPTWEYVGIMGDISQKADHGYTGTPKTLKEVDDELVQLEQEQIQGGVYDVSSHNDGAVFESLSTLLGSANLSTLIPTSVRRGGMSIRFIQGSVPSSDNKYAQYRLMSDTFSTTKSDWEEIDSSVKATAGSAESDLEIADEDGNVLVRFANGHIKVKNFDSKDNNESISAILQNVGIEDIPVFNEEESYEIGDIVRYNKLIYKFTSAHIADEWNSSDVEETNIIDELDAARPVAVDTSLSDTDLDVSDEKGNVLVRFSGGHIKTKNFDSENINPQDDIKSKYLIPDGTVALWDFCRTEDYLVDIVSGHKLTPINVTRDDSKGLYFNGSTSYLEIKNVNVGNLDVSKYGEEVTVMALVNPSEIGSDYIAGMWTENDNDPHREYGLFIDLPGYGGPRKVIGHVSREGGASPGLPYSRDYSASGRSVIIGRDSFIGMTYDGHVAKSYLDGLTDSYIRYTEPGAPTGQSLTYDKNPYVFNLGLNKGSEADFNVGANLLTNGMANFYKGYISKLIIVARCLSEKEMADMAYFYCKNTVFATFPNVESSNETIEGYQGGFKTRTSVGGTITDNLSSDNSVKEIKSTTESSLYISPSAETTALAYIESEYLYLSQISSFSFKSKSNGSNIGGVRLCIKVGDNWYASANIVPTISYTESSIQVDFSANTWYAFDFNNLSVENIISDEIANNRINAIGILFDSVSSGASVNIANIKINI